MLSGIATLLRLLEARHADARGHASNHHALLVIATASVLARR